MWKINYGVDLFFTTFVIMWMPSCLQNFKIFNWKKYMSPHFLHLRWKIYGKPRWKPLNTFLLWNLWDYFLFIPQTFVQFKEEKINSGRLSPSITAIASLFPVTGYLIANLAVADLSVGVLCIPFTVLYFELRYWPFGYALCKIIPTAQAMSVMASIGTLAAISLGKCCFA